MDARRGLAAQAPVGKRTDVPLALTTVPRAFQPVDFCKKSVLFASSTTPALYPAFRSAVTDYVIRCTGTAVTVAVSNSDTTDTTTKVSVDSQVARGGSFSAQVAVAA